MAASSSARRVASFFRSRRPSSCTRVEPTRAEPPSVACATTVACASVTPPRTVRLRCNPVTAPFAAATQVQTDSLTEACGEDPGPACRFVFEHTTTEWLAKLVDFLVARPLKILLILFLAWLLAKIARRVIRRFTAQLSGSAQS